MAHGKVRFGVIGTSRVARKASIPALIASAHAELVMIGGRDEAKANAWAEEFNCAGGTYEDVIASADIDAVYISLPPALHEEWVIKALAAGKHVWCEKPAALGYASAKRMVAAAEVHRVRLIEGFNFIYHPQQDKVRELIASGVIGEVRTVEGIFTFPFPAAGSNLINKQMGGGSYNDMGGYPLRVALLYLGSGPISLQGSLYTEPGYEVDTKTEFILTYPGGRSAHLFTAFGHYFESSYRVLGSEGRIEVERAYAVPPDRAVRIYIKKNDTIEELTIAPADQFKLLIDDFCTAILQGETSTKHYEEDLLLQARIIEAGRKAAAERRVVDISEIG